jgi:hypothetical protein
MMAGSKCWCFGSFMSYRVNANVQMISYLDGDTTLRISCISGICPFCATGNIFAWYLANRFCMQPGNANDPIPVSMRFRPVWYVWFFTFSVIPEPTLNCEPDAHAPLFRLHRWSMGCWLLCPCVRGWGSIARVSRWIASTSNRQKGPWGKWRISTELLRSIYTQ